MPCEKYGHTLRYKKGNSCVECQRLKTEDPEVKKARKAASERHRNNPSNTIKLRYLKLRYGLTVEQFKAMEVAQGGLCKICRRPPRGRWDRLHVDHDHVTGEVRGLLCNNCNMVLGRVLDSIEILEAAIEYLRNAKGRPSEGAAQQINNSGLD